jgi:cardiolipin synthase
VKLMIQPGAGVAPIVEGIKSARTSVQIMIFRFDRKDVEKALIGAAKRGVTVHALIAHTNRGGEKSLRALEMRLLAAGIIVARTADELLRYHAKMMIVDKRELYVLGFNFALMDIERSRSFGAITTNPQLVREAVKLFEADMKRQPYQPEAAGFVVSPESARKAIASFLRGAKRELLIYDPKIDDGEMIRILEQRADRGVQVRVLGRLAKKSSKIEVEKLTTIRLHTRTILRDGKAMFIGSQSLRTAELDSRREVGLIVADAKSVSQVRKVFEADWAQVHDAAAESAPDAMAVEKVAKKVAKVITKGFRPVVPEVTELMKKAAGDDPSPNLDIDELQNVVKDKIEEAVSEILQGVVQENGKHAVAERP